LKSYDVPTGGEFTYEETRLEAPAVLIFLSAFSTTTGIYES